MFQILFKKFHNNRVHRLKFGSDKWGSTALSLETFIGTNKNESYSFLLDKAFFRYWFLASQHDINPCGTLLIILSNAARIGEICNDLTKAFLIDYIGLLINSFRRRIPWWVLRHCGMNLRNGKDRHASIIWISTSRKGEERNGEQGKSEGFEQLLSDRSSLKSFHQGFIRQDSLVCEISPSRGFLR